MTPTPKTDELIVRALQGRATKSEERRLEAWLDASPENRADFEELRRLWRVAERASPSVRSATRPRADDLVRPGSRIGKRGPNDRGAPAWSGRQVRRWFAPLAAAAGVAAVAAGFHLFTISSEAPGFSFGVEEFSTGALETVTVRLGDGTIVRLAPSSGLRMDGTDGARNVWLEGQAFFAVAHHEEMPFTLHTRAGTATVLGTRFDVRAEDDDFRLVVVEGRVRVEAAVDGQPARELGPSEMTRIIEGGRLYVSQVPDVHALLDWMEGALIFQSTRLDRVAEELEHRYGISVEVVDPGVAGRTITAWFTDQPLAEAVRVICRAADVVCDVSETSVRIGM